MSAGRRPSRVRGMTAASRFSRRMSLQPRPQTLVPLPETLDAMRAMLADPLAAEEGPAQALPPSPLTDGRTLDDASPAADARRFPSSGPAVVAHPPSLKQRPLVVQAEFSRHRESIQYAKAEELRRRFSTIATATEQAAAGDDAEALRAAAERSRHRLLGNTGATARRHSSARQLGYSGSTAAMILRRRGVLRRTSEVRAADAQATLRQVHWLEFVWLLRASRALEGQAAAARGARRAEHVGATKIQTVYRARQAAEVRRARANFLRVTARYAWKLKLQVKSARRRMAAKWARQFLSRYVRPDFRTIVSSFRSMVIKAQRLWRQWLACRAARLRNLDRVWDRFEEMVRVAQRRAVRSREAAHCTPGSSPTNQAAKAMSRHMSKQKVLYAELQGNVMGLLEATGGAVDQFDACSISKEERLPLLEAHLAATRKAHIARHSKTYRAARAEWENAHEQREMLHIISATGPHGLTAKLNNGAELGAPRPRWPPLLTTLGACRDRELATRVRDLMLRELRFNVMTRPAGPPPSFSPDSSVASGSSGGSSGGSSSAPRAAAARARTAVFSEERDA